MKMIKFSLLIIVLCILFGCGSVNNTKISSTHYVSPPNDISTQTSSTVQNSVYSQDNETALTTNDTLLKKIKSNIETAHSLANTEKYLPYINQAMASLKEYLATYDYKDIDLEYIKSIKGFQVFSTKNSILIQYYKPYDIFGESGSSAWEVIKYIPDNVVDIVEADQFLYVQYYREIQSNGKTILYIYGENRPMTSDTAFIKGYEIKKGKILKISVIKPEKKVQRLWGWDSNGNIGPQSLKYADTEPYRGVESVSENGEEVKIFSTSTIANTRYTLKFKLDKNGIYVMTSS